MSSPVSHDIFVRRAMAVLRVIGSLRQHVGLDEAINIVMEEFVDREEHPELRRLGEVLAYARRQAVIQGRLDDDREALHHGHLDHEELVSTGHHYEMLRHQACAYNHLLRGLIESCGQHFTRDELLGWLTSASLGRGKWAKAEVTGAVSEIALHAALQGLPEIRSLRYAEVEEDLAGYDFIGEWQGKLLTIDAKTGFYAPLVERKRGHKHLEISVPREAVNGLLVNHRGLGILRQEIRQVLDGDSGAEAPDPRQYFRPASAFHLR
jgi:hypothetical protein